MAAQRHTIQHRGSKVTSINRATNSMSLTRSSPNQLYSMTVRVRRTRIAAVLPIMQIRCRSRGTLGTTSGVTALMTHSNKPHSQCGRCDAMWQLNCELSCSCTAPDGKGSLNTQCCTSHFPPSPVASRYTKHSIMIIETFLFIARCFDSVRPFRMTSQISFYSCCKAYGCIFSVRYNNTFKLKRGSSYIFTIRI